MHGLRGLSDADRAHVGVSPGTWMRFLPALGGRCRRSVLLLCLALGLAACGKAPPQAAAPEAPLGSMAPLRLEAWAGDGLPGLAYGPRALARFADPWGLARAADGSVYVADGGDCNCLWRVGPDDRVERFAGGREGWADGAGAQAAFHTPSGLAIDAAGNLYLADTGNHRIRKITPTGVVSTLAGDGEPGWRDGPGLQARFNGPLGVAVDGQGRVWVADTYNDRIRQIAPDGQVSTLAGGDRPGFADGQGAAGLLDTPTSLALDAQGEAWIADARNHAIRRLKADGSLSTLARTPPEDDAAALRLPLSVAVAPDGMLYVGTAASGALLQISAAGEVDVLCRGPEARFARPTALVWAGPGRLLLADAAAYRLHSVSHLPAPRPPAAHPPVEVLGGIGPDASRPLPDTAQRWPLRPQHAWHEIVGTLGEVRGNFKGDALDHLHDGLDIHAAVGAEVLAIADAKVSSALATWAYGKTGEGMALDALSYVHVRVGRHADGSAVDPQRFLMGRDAQGRPDRVRVRRGTRFRAGDVLGSVNAMAHVHLTLWPGAHPRNPLVLGFQGGADHQAPHITEIALLDAAGHLLASSLGAGRQGPGAPPPIPLPRASGPLQILVEAWDQVDGNEARRRLGLYSLGYQVLRDDGSPAPGDAQVRLNWQLDVLPSEDEAVALAYAADSGITVYGSRSTRFRYRATSVIRQGEAQAGAWDPAALPPGDYRLRIIARDFAGNEATTGRDLRFHLQ